MNIYSVEHNPQAYTWDVLVRNAQTGKITPIGSFKEQVEANNYMHKCIELEAQSVGTVAHKQAFDARDNSHLSEDEPTLDPQVKFTRSIKVLREAIIEDMRPDHEEAANALIDVAAMFICSLYEQGQNIARIAAAIESQTKMLAIAYNMQAEADGN